MNDDQPGAIVGPSKSSMNASAGEVVRMRVPPPAQTPEVGTPPPGAPLEEPPLEDSPPDELPLPLLPAPPAPLDELPLGNPPDEPAPELPPHDEVPLDEPPAPAAGPGEPDELPPFALLALPAALSERKVAVAVPEQAAPSDPPPTRMTAPANVRTHCRTPFELE